MTTTRSPALFIDLDGVLANFDGHYERTFGVRLDRHAEPVDLWENIVSVPEFFRNLPVLPDALALWKGAMALHPSPVILTGVPRTTTYPNAEAEKRAWVREHIGDVPMIATLSRNKRDHGKPGDILVDDWTKYRSRWEKMGGIFVLHTSAATSLAAVEELLVRAA